MPNGDSNPVFAFVWRPKEITGPVVETTRHTSTGAIFDIGNIQPAQLAGSLKAAHAKEIKVSAEHLQDPTLDEFLEKSGVDTIWVEYHTAFTTCRFDGFLDQLGKLSVKYRCIPITGDLDLLPRLIQMKNLPKAIALKGIEASGFVSTETTGILYAIARQMLRQYGREPDLFIWGGVATPEAAAAFLCSGVRGIVFESLHWQTDLVEMDDNLRQRIAKLRPDHTRVIGQNLGIPCRLFDKGNSKALKDLEYYANSLSNEVVKDQDRLAFAQRVFDMATPALESGLGNNHIIPLGPEAAFAGSFTRRFGRSTVRALKGFSREVARLCREAPHARDRFLNNPAAQELGTEFPFIQGAMSWITDVPAFALVVAEAGGLPTIALGMKDKAQLAQDLDKLGEVMGTRPFAVNIIALPENPCLDQQLDWIEQVRPPFVVIAAGDPSYIKKLQVKKIKVIYIAPDEGLMRMALEAGARYLILEGDEAGGHVGGHSTLTLAQIALELKRREPALFKDRFIILAGGIFNGETAFRAAMLGADAIQMGTAYLATEEIVNSGALTPLYQRMVLESAPGMTTLTGETIGLRVRALKTPKTDAIRALEREVLAGKTDEDSFRQRIETLSAGSLLIASRGIKLPGGPPLDEKTHAEEGQFMSGAVSGLIQQACTVSELHRELAERTFQPVWLPTILDSAPAVLKGSTRERIAITGMALVNSLGNSPREIWEKCLAMESGIVEVPPDKLDLTRFYDPNPRANGKTYCKIGAFQNINISRKDIGIPPQDFRTMAESTKLTLWLARQAIDESGILGSNIAPHRIGVLISQNSGEAASTIKDLGIYVNIHDILHSMQTVISISPEQESALEHHIKSGLIAVDDTTLLGRLNCAASGFICNRYGFTGPSHSVSAACATSLVALHSAIQMINNDIIDAAVVGGGEEILRPAHYLEFSALGALAGLSGAKRSPREFSRPFDAGRDGMVLGEGGALIVIERESVAKQRGAFIHAYITGIGASNNNRGMVESLAETQEIAVRASFRDADYPPDQVDLVECHATSTVQGDVEEVKALKTFFPKTSPTILTSFKSQIGHTLGASGLNSLIRGVAALEAGVYPPTLNYQTPDPEIGLEAGGFHVSSQPLDWPQHPHRPRRFMVNAFGFGGANYVVQLEQCPNGSGTVFVSTPASKQAHEHAAPEISAPTEIEGVCFFTGQINGRPHRMGVVATDVNHAKQKVKTLPLIKQDTPSPRLLREMARLGIFFSPEDTPRLPLAFVFAGQGTHYQGMSKELYDTFSLIREWMDRIAAVADFDILDLLFNSHEEDLQKTRWQQPALFTMEYAVVRYLMSLGLVPQAMAGHSLGELVALCAAGVFSYEDGFRIVNKRARCMDKAGSLSMDPGTMIAVDGPLELLKSKIAEHQNIFFTNFNSPHQIVLGGGTEEILTLMKTLQEEGIRTTQLKVSMAFHSPIMKVIHDEMEAYIADMQFHAPRIPVISNTTMKPFPDDPEMIKKIVMAHLESPVHWMQDVKVLWNDYHIRLFVEIGPKDTLCGLIADTVDQAQYLFTCEPEKEAFSFQSAVARLFSLGHLKPDIPSTRIDLEESPVSSLPGPTGFTGTDKQATAIIQREITKFVLETFRESLRPRIISAIRREFDPSFSEERLEELLLSGSYVKGPAPVAIPESFQPPSGTDLREESRSPAVSIPAHQDFHEKAPVSDENDHLEQVIRIIMDATGYERDEIEPDMDIRQDLAIRSSRLPVIMDAAEHRFGITIHLEDFIGVGTIRDMADRIAELISRDGGSLPAAPFPSGTPLAPSAEAVPTPSTEEVHEEREPLKRFIIDEVLLEKNLVNPLKLTPGQAVAVMYVGRDSALTAELAELFRRKLKARPLPIEILGQPAENGGFDLLTEDGAGKAADYLASHQSLAGLVLVLEDTSHMALNDVREVPALLTGFFMSLKTLMRSPAKKFCLMMQRGPLTDSPAAIVAEGVLGMYLAAAQEYSSVLFRSVSLDSNTHINNALDHALDTSTDVAQIRFKEQNLFTLQITNQPVRIKDEPPFTLTPEDVIVISGGGKGITAHLARSLAPFGPRLILLGRTELDPSVDYEGLLKAGGPEKETVRRFLNKRTPDLESEKLESEESRLIAGMEVTGTLKDLESQGLKVSYSTCDVSDSQQVAEVINGILARHGRIDGLIHGAGILRDSFMEFMTPENFSRVIDVKLLGFLNLFQAAKDHGLRMIVGLSSIAAVLGNVGQINYCAASRSLSAAIDALKEDGDALLAKTLMLPPIEGTGMADDPEIKELMKIKGMETSYINVSELSELFLRELFLGPPDQHWVIPARTIPRAKTVQINLSEPELKTGGLSSAGITFEPEDLPMIQTVRCLDLERGVLEVRRNFSLEHDPWLEDHNPFKFLKHPIVSGIMAIETFLEVAHLLNPQLKPVGIRNVQYKDILACPPGIEREAQIHLHRQQKAMSREVICDGSFSSRDISPTGRPLERWSTNYQGQVILGSQRQPLMDWPNFPVSPEEMDTRPSFQEEIIEKYETRSNMRGRYRVLEALDGTGPGVISGSMVYKETSDFSLWTRVQYQYSPYLLEALAHMAYFYVVMRDEKETRNMIPTRIEEIRFTRCCRPGERIIMTARIQSRSSDGLIWNACARDENDITIMQVRNLEMKWFVE